jgi:single-stranded-DNA-specific exonuclease
VISVLDKKWRLKSSDDQKTLSLMQIHNLSMVAARIVSMLEIPMEEVSDFLSPKLKNMMPNPYSLLDMDKAVARTMLAIKNSEKICIFGDYDVDGATSSSLLKSYFRDIDVNADIYIPDRILEGYGPTKTAMQKIKDSGAKVIITVDCGTSAFEALAAAKTLDLDVIVIDHHLGSESLPDAVAIINPNRLDENFKYNNIAAVGVSFLFLVALQKEMLLCSDNTKPPPNLLDYLDLVALGTVCDVMPLVGLNRVFVKQGLKVIAQRKRIGMNALMDVAGINEAINCYHLGFLLGPRINAGGRVGEAGLGAKLLCETDYYQAMEFAQRLDQFNNDRKIIEARMLNEALFEAENQRDKNIILIVGRDWHQGVIGIIASRIKEKFGRPAIVIALANGIGKASCRSITGVDLGAKVIEAKLSGLLIEGGGHKMAAGFTVLEEKIGDLQEFLDIAIGKDMQDLEDLDMDFYDYEVSIDGAADLTLIHELNTIGPFGNGLPEPIACVSDLFVLKARIVGNNHISCTFAADRSGYGSKIINAIAFGAIGTKIGDILMSDIPHKISVIASIKLNLWKDKESAQLMIKDIILS